MTFLPFFSAAVGCSLESAVLGLLWRSVRYAPLLLLLRVRWAFYFFAILWSTDTDICVSISLALSSLLPIVRDRALFVSCIEHVIPTLIFNTSYETSRYFSQILIPLVSLTTKAACPVSIFSCPSMYLAFERHVRPPPPPPCFQFLSGLGRSRQ